MSSALSKRAVRGPKSLNGQKSGPEGSKSNGSYAELSIDPEKLLAVLRAVDAGDFSGRLPKENGLNGEVFSTLNSIIEKNEKLTRELGRISEVVGKEGKLSERAFLKGADGGWESCIGSVNGSITDLALPTAELLESSGRSHRATYRRISILRSTTGRSGVSFSGPGEP